MFLKRQKEVSSEFSEYIAKNILNSQRVWQSIMGGTKSDNFREIVRRNIPLPGAAIGTIIESMQRNVGNVALHPLHYYTDIRLNLQVIVTHIVYYTSSVRTYICFIRTHVCTVSNRHAKEDTHAHILVTHQIVLNNTLHITHTYTYTLLGDTYE